MKLIEQKIIDKANFMCETYFMDFPDYDKDNPITTLSDALTILVLDALQDDELDSSEIYDFLSERLKEPDFETHEDDGMGFLTGDFTEEDRNDFKKTETMENLKTVWNFVEEYFPNYYSSDEILRNNDLSQAIEEGEEGLEQQMNDSNAYVYEKAIEGYLETLKS